MADFTSFIIHLALSAESIYSPADANRILRSDSLESVYEFAYESFRKEYESALEGDRMPVTVARGCLGMRILKNI